MKKIIKYVVSFSFIFLLFPVSVIAGEIIEAECTGDDGTGDDETILILMDTDGGKQNLGGQELDVTFTKDKAKLIDNWGGTVVIDFKNGNFYVNGEKKAICKFSNLEALEKESTVNADADAEVEVTELQEPKIYETKCGLETYYDDMIIVPTRISGPFSLDDFGDDGNIGVEVLVDGNGNQARFSGIVDYEKVGNRLELDGDEIETTVTKEQFQEHFGLFPTITCTAG